MQFPITIGLHRSRFLDAVVLLGALAASLAMLVFPVSATFQAGAWVAIWTLAAYSWRALAPKCSALRLARDGSLSTQSHAGDDFINVDLMPGATVHPWLTVFALQAKGGQVERLIVAFDSLPAEDFRRLRVFLRWQAEISDGSDDPA